MPSEVSLTNWREADDRSRVLQVIQPGLIGLIDGTLSTLAPIFGIVFYTHKPHTAFIAGLATSIGAAISTRSRSRRS